jgi:hypothetical protein
MISVPGAPVACSVVRYLIYVSRLRGRKGGTGMYWQSPNSPCILPVEVQSRIPSG